LTDEAGPNPNPFDALKTSIEPQAEVIRGEDPAALEALAAAFHAEYKPLTPTEAMLVDAVVHHAWLQRRLRKVEAETWEGERKRMQTVTHNDMTSGEVFAHHVGAFSRIQRRIDSTERNLHRSLDSLRRQQSERLASGTEGPVKDAPSESPRPQAAEVAPQAPLPAPVPVVALPLQPQVPGTAAVPEEPATVLPIKLFETQ
jgi:hypothetical protein